MYLRAYFHKVNSLFYELAYILAGWLSSQRASRSLVLFRAINQTVIIGDARNISLTLTPIYSPSASSISSQVYKSLSSQPGLLTNIGDRCIFHLEAAGTTGDHDLQMDRDLQISVFSTF